MTLSTLLMKIKHSWDYEGKLREWSKLLRKLHSPVLSLIKIVSCFSAKNPCKVILLTVVSSVSLLALGLFTNFNVVTDNHDLFAPFGSITEMHWNWIKKESDFDEAPLRTHLLIHANGNNVLGVEGLVKTFKIVDSVMDLPEYNAVCNPLEGENSRCGVQSVTQFWGNNFESFKDEITTDEEAIIAISNPKFPSGLLVDRLSIFGNPEFSLDGEYNIGTMQAAQSYSIQLWYPKENTGKLNERLTDTILSIHEEWEEEYGNHWHVDHIITDISQEREMDRAMVEDTILMAIAFIMMFVVCAVYFAKCNRVYSQSLLGIGAVLSIVFSAMMSFGILFTFGVPFTVVTQMLPFILCGIGLDDAFIIITAFSRTSNNMDVVERVNKAIDEIGMSIFITTISTVITFLLSAMTTIPSNRWFCVHAAFAIMIDFIVQISFFIAFLVYDQKRIDSNRCDIICCYKVPKVPKANDSNETSVESWDDSISSTTITEGIIATYTRFIMRPVTKVVVLMVFGAMLSCGIISAMQIEQYLDFTMLIPKDSYLHDYVYALDHFADDNYGFFNGEIFFRNIDASLKVNRMEMQSYVDSVVEGSTYMTKYPFYFWVNDFEDFVEENHLSRLDFQIQLTMFMETEPFKDIYADSILRKGNSSVISSRTFFEFDNLSRVDIKAQTKALRELREVSLKTPLNKDKSSNDWPAFTYSSVYYSWEFYTVVPEDLVKSAIYALVSMFLLVLLFVRHPSGSIFVITTVSMMFVEILGLFQVAELDINGLTATTLIMAIGLSIDFVIHIVHAYVESNSNTREGKVHIAMVTMGASLVKAGCSTFFGTMLLVFGASEIAWVFFVTFCGIVSLGIMHSLVFLPVILSIIGPLYTPENPSFSVTLTSETNK